MAAVCAPLADAHLHTTEDATATMRSMKLQADTGSAQQADVCYCAPATPPKPSAAVSDDDSAKSERIKSYAGASVLERVPPVDAHKEAIRAATMRHDLFNLVVLGIINLMNVHYLLRGTGVNLSRACPCDARSFLSCRFSFVALRLTRAICTMSLHIQVVCSLFDLV